MPIFPLDARRRQVLRDIVLANHLPRPAAISPEKWTDIQDGVAPALEGEELRSLADLQPGLLTRLRQPAGSGEGSHNRTE